MPFTPRAAVGLDFGTTNSSIAHAAADGSVRLAQFPLRHGSTSSFRSLLLFERDAGKPVQSHAGPAAMERYLQAEDGSRRLIQSLKSYLPSAALTGTEVFGRRYTPEDLLARMLRELRVGAENALGMPMEHAVVGRPVRFVGAASGDDEALALARLEKASHQAGFRHVVFEYEPVGAAWAYQSTLDHEELVLIGDFGGGTSDFSLLRLGPAQPTSARSTTVLGTGGVGLAGDAFDAKLVRHLVSPALGLGSLERSGAKLLPAVPAWIYSNLERWHSSSFLRTRNVAEILKGAAVRALEPEKIAALQALIDEDLGFELHAAVQRLKYELSRADHAEFRFHEGGLALRIPVTRPQFEHWIEEELSAIAGAVDALLSEAGIRADAVDRVFLPAALPLFRQWNTSFEAAFPGKRSAGARLLPRSRTAWLFGPRSCFSAVSRKTAFLAALPQPGPEQPFTGNASKRCRSASGPGSRLDGIDFHTSRRLVHVVGVQQGGKVFMQGGRDGNAAGLLNDCKRAGFGHGRGAATCLVLDFPVSVQVGSAVNNFHVLESGLQQLFTIGLDAQGSGNAADISGKAGSNRFGQLGFERDVAYGEASAGLQNPDNLSKNSGLIRREIDDAVGDDAIHGFIRKRQVVDLSEIKLNIEVAAFLGVGFGPLDHGRSHVNADGLPRRPNLPGGQKHVEAAAGPEIDDHFAGAKVGRSRRVAAGQSHVGLGGNRG